VHASHLVGVIEGIFMTFRQKCIAQPAVDIDVETPALLTLLGR
jgi:hypothetical protein